MLLQGSHQAQQFESMYNMNSHTSKFMPGQGSGKGQDSSQLILQKLLETLSSQADQRRDEGTVPSAPDGQTAMPSPTLESLLSNSARLSNAGLAESTPYSPFVVNSGNIDLLSYLSGFSGPPVCPSPPISGSAFLPSVPAMGSLKRQRPDIDALGGDTTLGTSPSLEPVGLKRVKIEPTPDRAKPASAKPASAKPASASAPLRRVEYTSERLGFNYEAELRRLRAIPSYTEEHGTFCVSVATCLMEQLTEHEPGKTFDEIALAMEGLDSTPETLKFVGQFKRGSRGFYFRPSTLNWKFGDFPTALGAALACDVFHRLFHFRGDILLRVLSGYLPPSEPQVTIVTD